MWEAWVRYPILDFSLNQQMKCFFSFSPLFFASSFQIMIHRSTHVLWFGVPRTFWYFLAEVDTVRTDVNIIGRHYNPFLLTERFPLAHSTILFWYLLTPILAQGLSPSVLVFLGASTVKTLDVVLGQMSASCQQAADIFPDTPRHGLQSGCGLPVCFSGIFSCLCYQVLTPLLPVELNYFLPWPLLCLRVCETRWQRSLELIAGLLNRRCWHKSPRSH